MELKDNADPKQKDRFVANPAETKTLDYVKERLRKMKLAKDSLGLEDQWRKNEQMMDTKQAVRKSGLKIKNPSKVKHSLTRSSVYAILALTAVRNTQLDYIGESKDDNKVAMVLQAISDYCSDKAKEAFTKLKTNFTAISLGTGIRKRIYRSDTRKVKEIISYDPATNKIEYEEKTVEDFNDVDLVDVDPRMFYIDETATCDDDARDCAERIVIPYSTFEFDYPKTKYQNVDKVMPGSWFENNIDTKRIDPVFPQVGNDEIEIFIYQNKQRDMQLTIANGVPIVDVNNPIPYKDKELMYTRVIFQLRDGKSYWGVGLPEITEHDQALLETLYNMLMDWLKIVIQKPCLRANGEESKNSAYELSAGKFIDVNDINNYKFLDVPPPDAAFYQGLKMAEQNAYKKIGLDDPQLGGTSGNTATETAIAAQAARDRLALFFSMLDELTEVRDERLKISRIQQFYSQPIRIKKITSDDGSEEVQEFFRELPIDMKKTQDEFGKGTYEKTPGEYMQIKAEDVGKIDDKFANFTVKVKAKSGVPISKELMQKRWMSMMTDLSAIPQAAAMLDWAKLIKETFVRHDYNSDDFLIDQTTTQEGIDKLSQDENDKMMQGTDIPSTQGAPASHSDRHRALITSTDFAQLDPEIQKVIMTHYEGEIAEQRKNEAQDMVDQVSAAGAPMPMAGQPAPGNQPISQ